MGLTVGEPSSPVTAIQLAVEPTAAVIAEAADRGADLLITHHPLLLRGIDRVRFDTPKGALIEALVRQRVALFVAHTNADSGLGGVGDCLADALGLSGTRPLEAAMSEPVDKLVTYVPESHADAVIDALAEAGAGRIGTYERCAFAAPGSGSFRPMTGADPYVGEVGQVERVPELRIEMVVPQRLRRAAVTALLTAHPYEVAGLGLVRTCPAARRRAGAGPGR